MRYGFIVAAGKQTRFNMETPKALVEINGKCLLDINIDCLKLICEEIYVICSTNNESYFNDKYNKIVIDSGYGSGDAIYKALNKFEFNEDDQVIIAWGDVILNKKLVLKFAKKVKTAVVPCFIEENPYVQFIPIKSNISVLFSKYGDHTSTGYHDMSIFMFNANKLKNAASSFVDKYMNEDNSYNRRGNEFELLELFNEGLPGKIIKIDRNEKSKSFNTVNEFNEIKKTMEEVK